MQALRPAVPRIFALVGFSLVLCVASQASAQAEWEANRGNCEDVLASPQNFDLDEIRSCARTWETYRNPSTLGSSEAQTFARGFSRLYYEGTASDQRLAETALRRMGTSVLPRGDFLPTGTSVSRTTVTRDTTPIHVGRSSSRARRRAGSHNSDGMDAYNRGDYSEAASYFERALEQDPWHVLAKYNLACQYSLLNRASDAVRHLDELSRWDIPESSERMARARVDEDFIPIRDDARFRDITGYTRAQLLNGAGAAGLGPVDGIRSQMMDADIDVASYGYERHIRLRPVIYYRDGYESTAHGLNRMLALPNTDVRVLTWQTDYDLVVVYGSMEAAASNPMPMPVVQGTWDGTILGGDTEEAQEEAAEAAEDAAGEIPWEPPLE